MPSKARRAFERRLSEDVDVLASILRELTGEARGRREQRMQVLHRSSVLLLTAAFEAYCEELLLEAVDLLATESLEHSQLPLELQHSIAQQSGIRKNRSDLFAWNFAGAGWRSLTYSYAVSRLETWNSPSSSNLQKIFQDLLGISDIRESLRWQRMSPEKACEKLDELIVHRGSIAHGTSVPTVLSEVQAYQRLVENVTTRIDSTVGHHLSLLLQKSPW